MDIDNNFLPLKKASKLHRIDETKLYALVESGNIRAVNTNWGILVSEKDVLSNAPKIALPEYKKFLHLVNLPILISEASRKYDISIGTISRWTSKGHIRVIKRTIRRTWIDEADIAYCAEVAKRKMSQGKRVFEADGTPYVKKRAGKPIE